MEQNTHATDDQGFVERTREFDYEVSRPREQEHTAGNKKGLVKRFISPEDCLPEHQTCSHPATTVDNEGFVERTREFDYEVSRPREQEHTAGNKKGLVKRFINPEDCLPEHQTCSHPTTTADNEGFVERNREADGEFVERTREFEYEVSRPREQEHTAGNKKGLVKRFINPEDCLPEHQTCSEPTACEGEFVERIREFDYEVSRPREQEHTAGNKKGLVKRFINPEDCLPEHQTCTHSTTTTDNGGFVERNREADGEFVERTREFEYEVSRPREQEHTAGNKKGLVKRFINPEDCLPEHHTCSHPTTTADNGGFVERARESDDGFVERTREFDYQVNRPKEQEHTAGNKKGLVKRFINPEDCLPEHQAHCQESGERESF